MGTQQPAVSVAAQKVTFSLPPACSAFLKSAWQMIELKLLSSPFMQGSILKLRFECNDASAAASTDPKK